MLFFSNPKRSRKRGQKRRRVNARRRKVRRVARVRSTVGGTMARRSRKRRARVSRRRRRRSVTVARRRRSGIAAFARNPRRRRYRRNPFGGGGSGVVATLKSGVKDGVVVLAAQVAARKAINLASAVNPIKGIPGAAITGLGVPVILTIAARKLLPSQARLVSAAAFAEGLRGLLAATPVGPFLSDYTADGGYLEGLDADGQLEAWPSIPSVGAWPTLGDDQDVMVQ